MKEKPSITVCGAGNAGRAIAADCSLMGYSVRLYELEKFKESIKGIKSAGGIEITGVTQSGKTGFAQLDEITTDPKLALENADIIMITAPAMGHIPFFDSFYKYLEDDQCILVNTAYWGSLRIYKRMKELGCTSDVVLAESTIMPYLSLESSPNQVHNFSIMPEQSIAVASFPGHRIKKIFDQLKKIYPQYYEVPNILSTNLEVGNPSIHPPFTLPIAGKVFDEYESCKYYRETSLSGTKIAKAFDAERRKIAEKFGIKTENLDTWVKRTFGYEEKSIDETLKKSVFAEFDFPSWALERTLDEDIGYSYLPLIGLAEAVNVEVPVTKAMTELFGIIFGKNYWKIGITLDKLGLKNLTKDEIVRFLESGSL
ncbi:hypothetical protein DRN58_04675 [Thermococci archaeon]|nr:MAG: hypothetical protein DRN58_04675 [Thermococci archaeon]